MHLECKFFLHMHSIKTSQVGICCDTLGTNIKMQHNELIWLGACVKKFCTVGVYKLNPTYYVISGILMLLV